MLVVIVLAAVIGGLLTVALAYPLGFAFAVLAAPLGASVSAVVVLSYLALRPSNKGARKAGTPASDADPYKTHNASANSDPLSPA